MDANVNCQGCERGKKDLMSISDHQHLYKKAKHDYSFCTAKVIFFLISSSRRGYLTPDNSDAASIFGGT